jgi:hypothetical protein
MRRRGVGAPEISRERRNAINSRLVEIRDELDDLADKPRNPANVRRENQLIEENRRLRRERDGASPKRVARAEEAPKRNRVIAPAGNNRGSRRRGEAPVRKPIAEQGRRNWRERAADRLVGPYEPQEFKPGDKKRIKNRENRYAKVTNAQLRRALANYSPKRAKPGETKEREARRRQERLEILQEIVNRGLPIPDQYKREVAQYRLKPQRRGRGDGLNRQGQAAVALERAAQRVEKENENVPARKRRANPEEVQKRQIERAKKNRPDDISDEDWNEYQEYLGDIPQGNFNPPDGAPQLEPVLSFNSWKRRVQPNGDGRRGAGGSMRDRIRSARTARTTESSLRRPQPKRFQGDSFDMDALDRDQKIRMRSLLRDEKAKLDAEWRKRLGLRPSEPITDKAIKDYIKARENNKPGAYIGTLKAKANDWKVLSEWQKKVDDRPAGVVLIGENEALNRLGPKRRNEVIGKFNRGGNATPGLIAPPRKRTPLRREESKRDPEVEAVGSLINRSITEAFDGSKPDDRSMRNVRNRFPNNGLPEGAFWREPDYVGRDANDRANHERRFGRYFDEDGKLNARGRYVNRKLDQERARVEASKREVEQASKPLPGSAKAPSAKPSQTAIVREGTPYKREYQYLKPLSLKDQLQQHADRNDLEKLREQREWLNQRVMELNGNVNRLISDGDPYKDLPKRLALRDLLAEDLNFADELLAGKEPNVLKVKDKSRLVIPGALSADNARALKQRPEYDYVGQKRDDHLKEAGERLGLLVEAGDKTALERRRRELRQKARYIDDQIRRQNDDGERARLLAQYQMVRHEQELADAGVRKINANQVNVGKPGASASVKPSVALRDRRLNVIRNSPRYLEQKKRYEDVSYQRIQMRAAEVAISKGNIIEIRQRANEIERELADVNKLYEDLLKDPLYDDLAIDPRDLAHADFQQEVLKGLRALIDEEDKKIVGASDANGALVPDEMRPVMTPRNLGKQQFANVQAAVKHIYDDGGPLSDIPDGVVIDVIIAKAVDENGAPLSKNMLDRGLPKKWSNDRFEGKRVKDGMHGYLWEVHRVKDKKTGEIWYLKTSDYGHDDAILEQVGAAAAEALEFGNRLDHIRVGEIRNRKNRPGRWIMMRDVGQMDHGKAAKNAKFVDAAGVRLTPEQQKNINPRDAARMVVLDFVMNNGDRHHGNFQVAIVDDDVRLAMIDMGLIGGGRAGDFGYEDGADYIDNDLMDVDVPKYGRMFNNGLQGLKRLGFSIQDARQREIFAKQAERAALRLRQQIDEILSVSRLQANGVKLTMEEMDHLIAIQRMANKRLDYLLNKNGVLDLVKFFE